MIDSGSSRTSAENIQTTTNASNVKVKKIENP
jgi:hypothetical protein